MSNKKKAPKPEQGVLVDCIQCTIIYPGKDRPNCPECKGTKSYFLPAQMMDKVSSQEMIVKKLLSFFKNLDKIDDINTFIRKMNLEQTTKMREACFILLRTVVIYNFELRVVLKDMILNLDEKIKDY